MSKDQFTPRSTIKTQGVINMEKHLYTIARFEISIDPQSFLYIIEYNPVNKNYIIQRILENNDPTTEQVSRNEILEAIEFLVDRFCTNMSGQDSFPIGELTPEAKALARELRALINFNPLRSYNSIKQLQLNCVSGQITLQNQIVNLEIKKHSQCLPS